jgi:hypothetical protein
MADNLWDNTKDVAQDVTENTKAEYNQQKGRAQEAWDNMKEDNSEDGVGREEVALDDDSTL